MSLYKNHFQKSEKYRHYYYYLYNRKFARKGEGGVSNLQGTK